MLYFFVRAMAKSQQEHGTLTKQHVLLYTDSIINKINQYECECEDCKEQCSTKNIIQIYANFKMLLTNSKFNNKGISQLLSQETDELEIYNTTIIKTMPNDNANNQIYKNARCPKTMLETVNAIFKTMPAKIRSRETIKTTDSQYRPLWP